MPFGYAVRKLRRVVSRKIRLELLLMIVTLYFYFLTRILMWALHLWRFNAILDTVNFLIATAAVLLTATDSYEQKKSVLFKTIVAFALVQFGMSFYKVHSLGDIIYNLKDNVIPVLWFVVGTRISALGYRWISRFLSLYLLFGGVYTLLFHTGTVLSMDSQWFDTIGLASGSNWWQGDVVRFWGMSSNFQEWYGLAGLILVYLFYKAMVLRDRFSLVNFTVGVLGYGMMNVIGPERASIGFVGLGIGIIFLVLHETTIKKYLMLSIKLFSVSFLIVLYIVVKMLTVNLSGNTAYGRLAQLLNPLSAGTIKTREKIQWAETWRLIHLNPSGVGASSLETVSATSSSPLVATHSFYLQSILAYSIWIAVPLFILVGIMLASLMLGSIHNNARFAGVLSLFIATFVSAAINPVMLNNWEKFSWLLIGLSVGSDALVRNRRVWSQLRTQTQPTISTSSSGITQTRKTVGTGTPAQTAQ